MHLRLHRNITLFLALSSAALVAGFSSSCSSDSSEQPPTSSGTGGSGGGATVGSTGMGGDAGGFIGSGPNPNGPFADFPKTPVFEGSASSDAANVFQAPPQPSGGPCLAEPPL